MKIAIATPTYNEAKNIRRLIPQIEKACKQLRHLDFTLLVIDDNSPDGTAAVAQETAANLTAPNLKFQVLKRSRKSGFGHAYIAGFNKLLNDSYDYIIQMDADLSHHPKYLIDFMRAATQGHDLVVGSRYVPGGGTPDWGWHRRILSRGGNFYARTILGSKISDYTGGYNMFSTALLKHIVKSLGSEGYGFLIELKYRALQEAHSPAQIPIVFHDRQHGHSKLPKSTLLKNLILVPQLKLARPNLNHYQK